MHLLTNIILLLSSVSLFVNPVVSDNDYPKLKPLKEKDAVIQLVPKEKNGKFGYADEKGRFKIKPVFDAVTEFDLGVAKVQYNGKWGVISKQAEYIFTPSFDKISSFSLKNNSGLCYAFVENEWKKGIINSSGEYILPLDYDAITLCKYGKDLYYLSKNDAVNSADSLGLFDLSKGSVILKPDIQTIDLSYFNKYGIGVVKKDGNTSVINGDGKTIVGSNENIWILTSAVDKESKSLTYVVQEGDKYAVSYGYSNDLDYCYSDLLYVFSTKRNTAKGTYGRLKYPQKQQTNSMIIPCYGFSAERINEENSNKNTYDIYSHVGDKLSIQANYAPSFNDYGNALIRSTNSQFYVFYDSKLYSFKDYNLLMKKSDYRDDNILPSWARIYSSDDEANPESTFGTAFPNFKVATYEWTCESHLDVDNYLFAFGIINEKGLWLLKPVLNDSPYNTLRGWTVYPCDNYYYGTIVSKDGKFGTIRKDGTLSMPLVFDSYSEADKHWGRQLFDSDFYAIIADESDNDDYAVYGIYDKDGNIVVPPKYKYYQYSGDIPDAPFFQASSTGLILLSTKDNNKPGLADDKWGVIDFKNNILAPLELSYEDAIIKLNELDAEIINQRNHRLLAPALTHDGQWVCIDTSGEIVIGPKYDFIGDFSEGFAVVERNYYYGYINKSGEEIAECRYEKYGEFSEGMAAVQDRATKKWGFINDKGDLVIEPKYDEVAYFKEGLACVMYDGRCGFINKKGETVIPFIYPSAGSFSEGLATVVKDDKYGYIDKTGNIVIPCRFGFAKDFHDGLAVVNVLPYNAFEATMYLMIDKKGRTVSSMGNEYSVWQIYDESDGLFRVAVKSKYGILYGFVDKSLNWVIKPSLEKKGDMGDFVDGRASYYSGVKYGYIDKSGTIVFPVILQFASTYSEGRALVKRDGRWGFINVNGKDTVPALYRDAGHYNHAGFAPVRSKDGWGFVDLDGNEVVKCQFEKVGSFN